MAIHVESSFLNFHAHNGQKELVMEIVISIIMWLVIYVVVPGAIIGIGWICLNFLMQASVKVRGGKIVGTDPKSYIKSFGLSVGAVGSTCYYPFRREVTLSDYSPCEKAIIFASHEVGHSAGNTAMILAVVKFASIPLTLGLWYIAGDLILCNLVVMVALNVLVFLEEVKAWIYASFILPKEVGREFGSQIMIPALGTYLLQLVMGFALLGWYLVMKGGI